MNEHCRDCGMSPEQDGLWIGCSESYPGSGRPSKIFARQVISGHVADACPEGGIEYPFNGMGGTAHPELGTFATETAAEAAVWDLIWTDSSGYIHWK